MLSFVQLDKPHIDIELYGTDTNISIFLKGSFYFRQTVFGCVHNNI